MLACLRPALVLLALMTLLCGAAYPLAMTLAANAIFPSQSQGSLIGKADTVIGSRLIGQSFTSPRYFWGRPSATKSTPYDASASGASQLAAANPALVEAVRIRLEALRQEAVADKTPVPVDLVTSSGSGLDPHISPESALYQASRVAKARGLDEDSVRTLVKKHIEPRQFGILGESRVNVLALNIALDEIK